MGSTTSSPCPSPGSGSKNASDGQVDHTQVYFETPAIWGRTGACRPPMTAEPGNIAGWRFIRSPLTGVKRECPTRAHAAT